MFRRESGVLAGRFRGLTVVVAWPERAVAPAAKREIAVKDLIVMICWKFVCVVGCL